MKFDLSNIPVCLITVSGGGLDEKQLYDLAYNTIEPQIERINGVASANVDGGKIRQIAVNLDRDLLYAKAISVLDVVRSVNDANFLMPSGDIKIGTVDYKLLTNNQFQLVKPMEDIVVRKVGDVPVRVRDLGYVSDSHEAQSSVVRVNGERAVYLRVKQPAANTIEVVDAVKPSCRSSSACRPASRSASRSTSPPTSGSRSTASGTSPSRAPCWRSWSSCCSSGASSRRASSSWRSRSRSCAR